MLDDRGQVTWLSTDPFNQQDLFYWDRQNFIGNGLATIFGWVTQNFLSLHRVGDTYANAVNTRQPIEGVGPLNFNSKYSVANRGREGYAVVYVNQPIGASGVLGQAGAADGDPEAFKNHGVPIRMDLNKIRQVAQLTFMPHNTLFHQVLAHETRHKVSLSHTTRGASWVVYAAGGIDALTPATFTQNPTSLTTFFNRFLTYDFHGVQTRERLFALVFTGYTVTSTTPVRANPQAPSWVYRTEGRQARGTGPMTQRANVIILDQDGTLMNWTPKRSQINDGDWDFRGQDKGHICLLSTGCN